MTPFLWWGIQGQVSEEKLFGLSGGRWDDSIDTKI